MNNMLLATATACTLWAVPVTAQQSAFMFQPDGGSRSCDPAGPVHRVCGQRPETNLTPKVSARLSFGSGALYAGLAPTTVDGVVPFPTVKRLSDGVAPHVGAVVSPPNVQHGAIGGLIGGVAGVVTCTVISNIVKDNGTGFSTCTGKGYALFGLSGVGAGVLVGLLME